jgi:hypothetical protein
MLGLLVAANAELPAEKQITTEMIFNNRVVMVVMSVNPVPNEALASRAKNFLKPSQKNPRLDSYTRKSPDPQGKDQLFVSAFPRI